MLAVWQQAYIPVVLKVVGHDSSQELEMVQGILKETDSLMVLQQLRCHGDPVAFNFTGGLHWCQGRPRRLHTSLHCYNHSDQ